MQVYIPKSNKDKIEMDFKQFSFSLICQTQINFMAECIDYTIFVDRLGISLDYNLLKSMDNNQVNHTLRPFCSIVIFDDSVDKERARMSGQIIRSKSSFQDGGPGYEFTIRVNFDENSKVFDGPTSIMNRFGVKTLYLDLD